MGRSKKTRGPEEILKSIHENPEEKTRPHVNVKSLKAETDDLDEVDESADDVELDEDDNDSDPEKTTELDLSGKPRRKPAARKPRTAARKKVEPAITQEEVTAVIEPELPKAQVAKPAKKAEPKEVVAVEIPAAPVTETPPAPDHLREDASIAAASLYKSMDSMVKQWSSVKEISGSICTELERVNTMLKTPAPQPEPADIKEYLKLAAPRITFANKIALGVSTAAVVLSVLSLSLASSTRTTVLEQASIPRVAFERRAPKAVTPKPVVEVPAVVVPPKTEVAVVVPPEKAKPAMAPMAITATPAPFVKKPLAEVELLKDPAPVVPKPRKQVAAKATAKHKALAARPRSHKRWQ